MNRIPPQDNVKETTPSETQEAPGTGDEYLSDKKAVDLALPPDERTDHLYEAVLMLRSIDSDRRFELGAVVATPGAEEALTLAGQTPWVFLARHARGDWGHVSSDDWQENEFSIKNGLRLMSVYQTAKEETLWVITEADRSATTLLLPEEY
jgi:hypothetical protein